MAWRWIAILLTCSATLAPLLALGACKPKTVGQAEADRDVKALAESGSPEAIAALGRLADADTKALKALEARPPTDVNTYIAAWAAVTRTAPWGATFLRAALNDPLRADVAATALPRRDARLVPFVQDLENAVVRLAAGHRGSVIAGVLASIGPSAHGAVERRLLDPKTRGAMCDGIGLPEASGDAKSLVLAVPPEARDNESCVGIVLDMATKEDVVLGWLATGAEPGLLSQVAKSSLACPRLATIWSKGLAERPPGGFAALSVPLQVSIRRCAPTLDPVLADALEKAPASRACIVNAVDPFGGELVDMKKTCRMLGRNFMFAESARVRERASDAVANGCKFAK
jgi:hypothetical protein